MENAAWDVASARGSGIIPSFLQPLDKRVPMVATVDIAQVAAELLQEDGLATESLNSKALLVSHPSDSCHVL